MYIREPFFKAFPQGRLANRQLVAYCPPMEAQQTLEMLRIAPTDDRYTVREILRRAPHKRLLLVFPWEATDRGWQLPLDFELLRRTAAAHDLELALVIEDPDRRPLAREAGFTVFGSEAAALDYVTRHGRFPTRRRRAPSPPPSRPAWAETPEPRDLPVPRPRPWWRWVLEGMLTLFVLGVLAGFAFLMAPSAHIRLIPQSRTYSVIVPISVDPTLEQVDLQRNLIPSRRIGDEFESYAEIRPTGQSYAFSGKATGYVIFTNLLAQPYRVPKGTLVRTSAGSYPVRFVTTEEITVPPLGQERAPIEATEEGPRGNVDAFQINFVEGVAGFALRVTNPEKIAGAESQIVATVSEADRERLRRIVTQQVLAMAYDGLLQGGYLRPGELLPRQTLIVQATPKAAFTHLVGEQTEVLGLSLRLLVTAEAIDARDAQAVAYRQLARALPEGYTLTDARFEFGESAEEDVGPGRFTFYVTAHGYATASLDLETARRSLRGTRVEAARQLLAETLPLAVPPEITIKPEWFPFIPHLDMRTQFEIIPAHWTP